MSLFGENWKWRQFVKDDLNKLLLLLFSLQLNSVTAFQASTLVHYLCSLKCDAGKVFSTSSFFNIKSSNANKTLPQILLNTNNINNYQIFNPSNNLRPQHFTFTVRKTFSSTILFYLFFLLTKIHIHFPIFVLVLTSNPFPFDYLTNTWPVLTSTSCTNSHTKIFTYYSWNHVHSP